ncbi:Regulator of chromosome condensation (RCC1) repeat protein [compost metagenome]
MSGANFAKVTKSNYHSLALGTDGRIYCWGYSSFGEFGNGFASRFPNKVAGSWIQVSAGTDFAVGMKSDFTLWAWGLGTSGQMGDGNTTNKFSPVQVSGSWVMVTAGVSAIGVQK